LSASLLAATIKAPECHPTYKWSRARDATPQRLGLDSLLGVITSETTIACRVGFLPGRPMVAFMATQYPLDRTQDLQVLLTVDEVAILLRTTRKSIYTRCARGQLPGVVRLGRRILFQKDVLLAWVAAGFPPFSHPNSKNPGAGASPSEFIPGHRPKSDAALLTSSKSSAASRGGSQR
jgi:excisionase family DNA binding protein